MAGVNLAFFGLAPVTLFGNYFSRSGTVEEFAADLSNWGVHAQLKLWGPARARACCYALFRWGGVDLTTGIEHARLHLTLARAWQPRHPRRTGGGQTGRVVARGGGQQHGPVQPRHAHLQHPDRGHHQLPPAVPPQPVRRLRLRLAAGRRQQPGPRSRRHHDRPRTGSDRQTAPVDLGTATVDASESVDPSPGRLRWLAGAPGQRAAWSRCSPSSTWPPRTRSSPAWRWAPASPTRPGGSPPGPAIGQRDRW